jgi:hypothetical protein
MWTVQPGVGENRLGAARASAIAPRPSATAWCCNHDHGGGGGRLCPAPLAGATADDHAAVVCSRLRPSARAAALRRPRRIFCPIVAMAWSAGV